MHRTVIAWCSAVALVSAAEALRAAPASDVLNVPAGAKARRAVPLPSGETIELTLHQTVVLTLQNVLDLDVAAYNLDASGFGIQAAKGAFDPSLEFDLGAADAQSAKASRLEAKEKRTANADLSFGGLLPHGTTYRLEWKNERVDEAVQDVTTLNPSYASGLTARFTQPLLRNFGTTANERFVVQANLTRDTSGWDFVRAVQTAIQLSEYAYWDLVYAVENLRAKKEALARARDLNRITKIKIDVGALAPIDIVQTEVTIAQREQDIITAEGLIGEAQDRLRRLLNVQSQPDWSRPIIPTDRPTRESLRDAFKADVETGFRRAMETRPEVREALVSIESKKVARAYTKNQLKPRLDLSASYGFSGLGAQAVVENPDGTLTQLNYSDALQEIAHRTFPNWAADVAFSVPIGNNVAHGNNAIADADLELSRTNFAITKANLQVEIRAAARAIDTATRSVAASAKARELAERNLEAERKKFENGMTTSFQVAQVQNDLTAASTSELQAIATYLKSVVSWHKAVGDILEVERVVIEGLPVTIAAIPTAEHAAPRTVAQVDARERASDLLQIYRDSLRPGADDVYRAVEEDAARICAELDFPNPHLALESLSGPKEVWWLNAFPSEDARKRVASDYAGNRPLVEALDGIARRKEGLVAAPVDQIGRYRSDLSHGAVWDPAGGRFVVATVTRDAAGTGAAVFETPDGTFFALRPARSRDEAETFAREAGPGTRLFAVRPNWGMPAKSWVAADPDFWKPSPAAGRH